MFSRLQPKALQAQSRKRRSSFLRLSLEVLEDRITPTLTLTQAGLDLGLSLTTFASGFPDGSVVNGLAGPSGIAIPTTGPYAGSVFVSNPVFGQISLFPTDQDNQTAPTQALPTVPSSNQGLTNPIVFEQGLSGPLGLTTVGGNIYFNEGSTGSLYLLNSTGNQFMANGMNYPAGMVVNPTNGHILIAGDTAPQIYDYDPATGILTNPVVDPSVSGFDGLTITPDGKTVYTAVLYGDGNPIKGYDLSTGQLVFDSGTIPGVPDGVALVPENSPITGLAGDLIVNTNGGTVVAINPTTDAQTVLASGGSRGDFVAVDPTNGTLLVTQSDSIMRISPDIFEKVTVGPITAPLAPVAINTTINTSASFTDTLASATHTAVWNWGDGATSSGTVTESNGSGTVSGSHAYTAAGVYTVALTVMNNLDNSISGQSVFNYVVAYDPSAGFVTGGGWLNSPAGAVPANPTLTGKANFGFNVKYQSGSTVPTGQTELQFPAANLDFHSTSYDWLVLNGSQAQFQGSGTINGTGNYGFLIAVADNDASGGGGPDAIRIQIWDKNNNNAIVYDTQPGAALTAAPTTLLGGGDIQAHTSSAKTEAVVISSASPPAPLPGSNVSSNAGSSAANSQGMTTPNSASIPSSDNPLSVMDEVFTDFALLLSAARNIYQWELSSVAAMWQSVDALALQRLDALLSIQAGRWGCRKIL
jgi:hypothetical protein